MGSADLLIGPCGTRFQDSARPRSPKGGFEQTTVLVAEGAFRYVRHPMYGSLLLLAFGALLKSISWLGAGLAVLTTLCLVLTALAEEQENLARFGPSYAAYRARTRMFIPWLF